MNDKTIKQKAKKHGKNFENEIINSVKKENNENLFFIRLKDSKSNFKNVNNKCDFLFFLNDKLFLFEAKTVKGKSLPLQNVRENQISGMTKESLKKNIKCGFLIKFYECNEINNINKQEVYYISVKCFNDYFIQNNHKKSIPKSYIKKNGIKLEQKLKRINYNYNLLDLINKI